MKKKKYSIKLTEEEWKYLICVTWFDHNFALSEKIENKLKKFQSGDDVLRKK